MTWGYGAEYRAKRNGYVSNASADADQTVVKIKLIIYDKNFGLPQ